VVELVISFAFEGICTLILLIKGLLGIGKLLWRISELVLNRFLELLSIRLLGEYWAGRNHLIFVKKGYLKSILGR
jgi:hypothetical protein